MDLEEIKARLASRTPGEWHTYGDLIWAGRTWQFQIKVKNG